MIAVELWSINRPKPYPRNARKISDAAAAKVAASIQEFGWRQPIVVDVDGVVVAGHVRLLAAHKLALSEVPVHIADNLTPSQIKTYRLMDNRSHEETGWDLELLGQELAEIQALDVDASLTGFDAPEISTLFAPDAETGDPDETVSAPQRCPKCGALQGDEPQ